MKQKLSITAGIAVSAALLWLACRRVDFNALAGILAHIELAPLPLVLLGVCAELLIRGVKWRILLAPSGPARTWDAIRIEAAGLALNNVLPLRLGEIVRAAFAANFFKIPLATILSTILAEKALDLAALLTLAAAAAAASGIALPLAGRGPLILIATIAFVVLAVIIFGSATSKRPNNQTRLQKTFNGLKLGLTAFTSPGAATSVCSLALLQWFVNSLNYYWLSLAFGMQNSVTVTKSILLSFTGAAASSAPGIPGYFGSFEFGVSAVLTAWGISSETALAYAVSAHLLSYLVVTAAGVFFVYQMGHSLGKIWQEFSVKKPEGKSVPT
ncbi:MAG: lysylphosphatidylglycerol synthase transmembrane domain-containing protein [Elusimicrobiales bacterium]|nr:lysylphosphatidylglycerol synthase transmembrane domain-containing protein [Elusimicrobiales bacterium]